MNRDELVQKRSPDWKRLTELVQGAGIRGGSELTPQEIQDLARHYRALAADLMRVRRDRLGADLERYLDDLASQSHNVLYGGTSVGSRLNPIDFLLDFAPAVRRNLRFFLIAMVLFYVPYVVGGLAAYESESYALAVLDASALENMEKMHGKVAAGRDANDSATMTGFYVFNNVGIAFRCFATGILYGLGPLFFLLYNGLVIGVAFGHLVRTGNAEAIFSFTASHGSWELTAIVLSGAAGMQMGYAMVSTHGRTRIGNLQAHGLELVRQIVGVGTFLTIAAIIEAWISPSALPPQAKYVIGACGWIGVHLILAFAGRDRSVPEDVIALRRHGAPPERAT